LRTGWRVGGFGTEAESAFKSGPCAVTLAGFSLHAATFIKEDKRDRLETLCRYLLRRPVSEKRLERRNNEDVLLRLKSEWSDGTLAIEFTPHEFIEKLIAIIPQPRIHRVRVSIISDFLSTAFWKFTMPPLNHFRKAKNSLTSQFWSRIRPKFVL